MIDVIFPAGYDEITAPKLTQWDYGQRLKIHGLSLPNVVQVHFCDKTCDTAIIRIAYKQEDGHSEVDVPNILLQNKYDIHAFIYLTNYEEAIGVTAETVGTFYTRSGNEGSYAYTAVSLPSDYVAGTTYYKTSGKTTKAITIPVNERTKPEDFIEQPDPSEQEIIDELLDYCRALGAKVDEYRTFSDIRIMTKAEYQALQEKEEGVIYAFSDDTTLEEINAEIDKIKDGTTTVGKATNATNATNATKATYTDFTNEGWIPSNPISGVEQLSYYVDVDEDGFYAIKVRHSEIRDVGYREMCFLIHYVSEYSGIIYDIGTCSAYSFSDGILQIVNYRVNLSEINKVKVIKDTYVFENGSITLQNTEGCPFSMKRIR